MDGVLCDFEKQARLFFKDLGESETLAEYKKRIGSNVFWAKIRSTGGEFWRTMPPTHPDVKAQWDRMESMFPHIAILSSPDSRDEFCIPGKRDWIETHLGPRVLGLFRSDKHVHSSEKSILVDDLEENTVPWEAAGGKAILFTSFDDAFWERLESYRES